MFLCSLIYCVIAVLVPPADAYISAATCIHSVEFPQKISNVNKETRILTVRIDNFRLG